MEKQQRNKLPVGVFDSGVGGISVLRELVRLMPGEDYLFFGDSANAPYGVRSREEIRDLTLGHVRRMVDQGIKAIVIACNTATSAAISDLREVYTDMPVIGIEPALKPAVMTASHPKVLVLATPGTVAGEKFQHLVHGFEEQADIRAVPCPGLMEFVENGQMDSPELYAYLENRLAQYRKDRPDAVVLGCTHYPFIKKAIRQALGGDCLILDGGEGTARETRRRLEAAGLRNPRENGGRVVFEMSLPGKEALCHQLLNAEHTGVNEYDHRPPYAQQIQ